MNLMLKGKNCESVKDVLSCDITDNPGWFGRSKDCLAPFFIKHNELLLQARNSKVANQALKDKCRDAKRDVVEAV